MILVVSKLGKMIALEYVLPSLHFVQVHPAMVTSSSNEESAPVGGAILPHTVGGGRLLRQP